MTRFIHEGGLTSGSAPESKEILERYGARPVLRVEAGPTDDSVFLLSKTGRALSVQVTSFYSTPTSNVALLLKTFDLAYDVGACLYHCANLAKVYESIVGHFKRISLIPGFDMSTSSFASFGHQTEPYYELDALLSAARRAYNRIGHCAWQAFEGGGGGMPDNLSEAVDRLRTCPEPLAERLRKSWSTVGEGLKAYRDCTQHFASTDIGMGTVTMKQVADGVWRAWARIPDNPEVKSRKKFTYASGLDALTYGWEVVDEVVSLAAEVLTGAAAAGPPPETAEGR